MLRKIILPVVLLIFTHQEFYGMKGENDEYEGKKAQVSIWRTINNFVNEDESGEKQGKYPKLWFLWAFLDNIPFQYGDSKIWKHGEAYYGLSNGIGFFPSFLNFGWLKIGIIDAHINVINAILHYFKNFIKYKIFKENDILSFLLFPILFHSFFNFHIFSVKILNCIKIKLVAPLILIFNDGGKDNKETAWYITYNKDDQISWWYVLLSPHIEINISGIIKLF